MSLLQAFNSFIETGDIKTICKELDVYPSTVKRWRAKTHSPGLEVLALFHDKLFKPQEGTPIQKVDSDPESLTLGNWEGKNVCVLFPCYKTTNPATAWALFAAGLDYGKAKICGFMELGNALIYKSRNKLADQFLRTEAEYSIWLDDDVVPPIGRAPWFRWVNQLPTSFPEKLAGRHFIERLTSHKKTLVGGLYFGRQRTGNPMFHEGLKSREANNAARHYIDELRPTEWVATGALCVHRQVFLDIRKEYPELEPKTDKDFWGYFNPIGSAGEDVSFCIRAKKAGHQAYVDLGLHCTHIGYAAYGAHNTIPPS